MARKEEFTPEEIVTALIRSRGFISVTAENLGCNEQTVRNYIAKYPECKTACDEAREKTLDHVESKLLEMIGDKNVTAAIFYLKTQGKNRGYVERQEISGPDGDNLVVEVSFK